LELCTLIDRNHPALFDLYRTGEVSHGYCGTDDEATKIQKAIFLKLKAKEARLSVPVVYQFKSFRQG